MFNIIECFRSALFSIRAHSFRSILTVLGIIIGIASVIATISIVQGLSESISKQFEGLGSKSLTVSSYTSYEDRLNQHIARITPSDFEKINDNISGIDYTSPVLSPNFSSKVRYGARTTSGRLIGTTSTYSNVNKLFVENGRFLSERDNKRRRRVCVIGVKVRDDLMLPINPTGEFIEVNSEWVKVVGLIEAGERMFPFKHDNTIIFPYETMQSLNGNLAQTDIQIQLAVNHLSDADIVAENIRNLLRRTRNIREKDDDFKVKSSDELKKSFSEIAVTVTLVMGGIVCISLLVGGIGIMNIMLVSVTERTREIGICKAIGAKRKHILSQFLIESIVLCMLGGIIGLFFGFLIAKGVAAVIPKIDFIYIPWWSVSISLGFPIVIGLVFGIVPAIKAANLDPIESLRYE
ncbi:ABC transporter permease [Teredinibacter haidensis]|uniref:ABC transporter permease n=1 Tax=Teredinibacter haidensis TaxID=2731755 RepID=UPI0015881F77|nr:ABC transporter permease [Teredinibacter haidensis]